jgi:hypothetical protein
MPSQNTKHRQMEWRRECSPSVILTGKGLVAPLGTLVPHHAMESVTRVVARRTVEHRLVLLGSPRYDKAPVDGLPLGCELQSTRRQAFPAHKRLVLVLVEPGCPLDVPFDDGAGFIV